MKGIRKGSGGIMIQKNAGGCLFGGAPPFLYLFSGK